MHIQLDAHAEGHVGVAELTTTHAAVINFFGVHKIVSPAPFLPRQPLRAWPDPSPRGQMGGIPLRAGKRMVPRIAVTVRNLLLIRGYRVRVLLEYLLGGHEIAHRGVIVTLEVSALTIEKKLLHVLRTSARVLRARHTSRETLVIF